MTTEFVRGIGGEPLACYEEESRQDVRWADDLRLVEGASPVAAADRIMAELSGWGATTQASLGAHLVNSGATVQREFDTYTHGLRGVSRPLEPSRLPANLELRPAESVDPEDLRATYAAAYPIGHPDHDMSGFEDLRAVMAGTLMGPLLPVSTVLIDTDRGLGVAAVLAHACTGLPPDEGPWISEVFRDPTYRGVGSLLLRYVLWLSAQAGLPALGLAATAGNHAAGVYEMVGFVRTAQWVDLFLP